jgi:hypothetical protein
VDVLELLVVAQGVPAFHSLAGDFHRPSNR